MKIWKKVENHLNSKLDSFIKKQQQKLKIFSPLFSSFSFSLPSLSPRLFLQHFLLILSQLKEKIKNTGSFILGMIRIFLSKILSKEYWQLHFNTLKENKLLLFAWASSCLFVIVMGFLSSSLFYTQKGGPSLKENSERTLASDSTVSLLSPRKSYYNLEKRQIHLVGLLIPVFFENIHDFKTISLDIVITLKDRYSTEFFKKREYLLYDLFNSSLYPMASVFPLDEEGKRVIKEKIKEEVNLLLKQQGLESSTESVEIEGIIAA